MWDEGLKGLAIGNSDELFDMVKAGPLRQSLTLVNRKLTDKWAFRLTYLGSETKTKLRAHSYMWEAKLNDLYVPLQHTAPASEPSLDPV